MQKKIVPSYSRSLRPRSARAVALASGAAFAAIQLWPAMAQAGSYVTYVWNPNTGSGNGSWSASSPSNWNDGTAVPDPTNINNQIIFNTAGTSPSVYADFGPPVFNLSNLTVTQAATDTVNLVTTPGQSSSIDTLNFVQDSAGDAPSLLVNSGSLNVQNACNFAAGSVITNYGSGNLILGANNQGGLTLGNNTVVTNAGNGLLQLVDGIPYDGNVASTVTTNVLTFNNSGGTNGGTGTLLIGNLGEGASGTVNIFGPVGFSGQVSGSSANLFGNFTVLNVSAGSSFNFASNAETMGGLIGSGSVILGSANLSFVEPGDRAFNGSISGTGGVGQATASILTLNGSNSYSGATTITADGTIRAGAANVLSPNSVVNITGGTLDLNGFNQTIAGLAGNNESLSLPLGSSTLTINPATGTSYTLFSPVTGSGNLVINGPGTERLVGINTYTGSTNIAQGTLALNVTSVSTSSVMIAAGATLDAIAPANVSWTATMTGSGSFIKDGPGTLTFSSATALTPSGLTVAAGTLVLDQTTDNNPKLGTNVPLSFTGGSLSMLGNSGAASSQTFGGLTMASATGSLGGYGQLSVTSGNNQNASISLGNITRNVGSVVDFELNNTGTGVASIATGATVSNGILGGWATVGKSNWATVTGGVVTPLGTYASTFASGNNTAISASTAVSGLTTVTNSLLINSGGAITFNASSALLTLQSGGILVPPTVTAATSIGVAGTVGKIASGSGELIINNYSPFPFTVYSAIQNASTGTSVVIAGTGTTIFNASNPYLGTTYINSGTLQISATGNLGNASSGVVVNGGTLSIPSGTAGAVSSTLHPFVIGPAGATFNFGASFSWSGNGLSGSGPILKTGAGTWSVGSNASPYSGSVTVMSPGVIRFTSDQFKSITGMNISSGAQYLINDNGSAATSTATYNFAPSAQLILAGDGPATSPNPGAFSVTVQTGGAFGPNVSFTNPVYLAANASFGTWNLSSPAQFATLTLTNQISGPGNLTKLGDGMLTLTNGENVYGGSAGTTTIVQGTLRNGVVNALPPTSTLQFGLNASATAGIYDLNGFNQTLAGLTVSSGTGHQIVNNNTSTQSVLTVNYNGSSNQVFTAPIGGGSIGSPASNNIAFVKGGTGTLTLSGSNTFSGDATVASGVLRIVAGATNTVARNYNIDDGATLIVSNTDGTTMPMNKLSLGNSGSQNLNFELSAGTPASGLIATAQTGGIVTNGVTTVAVNSTTPLTVGEYPLIEYYAGTLTGNGFAGFNPTPVIGGRTLASLVNNTSNGTSTGSIDSIDLVVTGVDFIKWNGTQNSGAWDINTTSNFNLNSSGAATTYLDNPSPDAVVFDDSATGTRLVNLTTTLSPSSVTINNNAGDYTFTGTGLIAGSTGLIKNGSSTLNVLTNNNYTGTTTINGGSVVVGNGLTSGSLGTGPIVDNASLAYNRSDSVVVTSSISGTGSLAMNGSGSLTLNNVVNIGGNLAINAGSLIVAGGGSVAGDVTGPGSFTISSGPFQIGTGGTTGTLNVDTNLTNNGTLVFNRSDTYSYNGNIDGNGGINVANGTVALNGSLNYSGSTVIGANSLVLNPIGNTTLTGKIVGTGTITYNGSGQLLLLADSNQYTGNLVVNSGSVMVADESFGGQEGEIDSTNIIINNGGRFIFGMGGIAGENPNFPNSTYITVNTGGIYEIRIGEVWGATSLQGGTYQISGGAGSTFGGTGSDYPTPPFLGFDLQSGTVQALGGVTGNINASSAGMNKTTAGEVTFLGPITYTAGVPINIMQGTLSFQSNNIPTSGTGAITIGNNQGPAILQMSGGSATIARPITLNTGADIDLPSVTNAASGVLTVSGQISGSADLTLTGTGTLKLSSSNSYSGNTNIAGGTLVLNTAGTINSSPLVEVGSGTAFQLAGQTNRSSPILVRTLPAINLSSPSQMVALASNQQSNRQVIVPTSISFSGTTNAWTSLVDLRNNDLIVHGSNLATVTNQVAQGYAGGTWQGSGGISSATAAGDSTHLTALGIMLNDNGSGSAVTSTFDTANTNDGDVLVKFTYYGDANLDGSVSSADYTLIDNGYLTKATGWQNGDFNYDNVINGSDYTLIDNAFNMQGASLAAEVASPTAQIGGTTSAVPEPASLGLLAIAGLGLLGRRRRA